jgi:hypothetical protein
MFYVWTLVTYAKKHFVGNHPYERYDKTMTCWRTRGTNPTPCNLLWRYITDSVLPRRVSVYSLKQPVTRAVASADEDCSSVFGTISNIIFVFVLRQKAVIKP